MAQQSQREGFQPDLPGQRDQDYLGYSRGIDVPRGYGRDSLDALFSGVADVFNVGINAVDQMFQSHIRDEATEAVDQVRGEFGVDAVAATQAPAGAGPQPNGLSRAYREIEGLTAAVQSGRLKESHYWGRLDSVARQLRHKYPGYREQIDQVISRLTGATPANAVRRSLMQEAEDAMRGVGDADKQFLSREATFAGQGLLGPDYWKLKEEGKINSLSDLSRYVSPRQYAQSMLSDEKLGLETEMARGKIDEKNRATKYASSLHNYVATQLSTLVRKDFPQLMDDIQTYARGIEKGQNGSAEDVGKLIGQLQLVETNLKLGIEQFRNKRGETGVGESSWAEIFGASTDYKAIEESITNQVTILREALEKGDVALLKSSATFLKAGQDATSLRMYRKYPELQNVDVIRKSLGDTAFGIWVSSPGGAKVLSLVQNIQLDGESAKNLLTARPLKESLRNAKSDGNANAQFTKQLLSRNIGVLLNPNTPDDVFSNVVEAMYGTGNIGFHNEAFFETVFRDPKTGFETRVYDQHNLFNLMTTEQIAQRVKKVSEEKGLPQLWENYKGWTNNTGTALAKRDLDTWKEQSSSRVWQDGSIGIWFNPESNKFETFEKKAAPLPSRFAFEEATARDNVAQIARDLTYRLNASFLPILNIHKLETSAKPVEIISRILAANGIDLRTP